MGRVFKFGDGISTDAIMPGRYNVTTDFDSLRKGCFIEARPDFVETVQPGDIIVAGRNFGCGSSREHAPWALLQYGFRAVVSTSFADIFKGNSLKNGLLPIAVSHDVHDWLFQNPDAVVKVDLASQSMTLPDGRAVEFPVDPFSRHCLLEGVDELGYILQQEPAIAQYESKRVSPMSTIRG